MCMEKHVFVKKNLYKWAKQAWVEKTVHGIETLWLSGGETVLGAAVSKEGNADSVENWKNPSYLISSKKMQL